MHTGEKNTRQAEAEVEALLDHLFHHANTPTFVTYRRAPQPSVHVWTVWKAGETAYLICGLYKTPLDIVY